MNALDLIVIPDEDEPGAAELLVDGVIGDRRYRFLLDTGAARSSILFDSYTATFASSEKNESSGVFAKSSYDLIAVPSIRVGPIYRAPFTMVRAPKGSGERRNLIGMDLLNPMSCHFLFDENQMVVDGEHQGPAGAGWQELLLDDRFHPYVNAHFGALSASAVWDTGAGITVVDMGFIEHNPVLFQPVGTSTGTDSTGAQRETPMFQMQGPVIGGYSFAPLRVAGVDLAPVNATIERPMDLILGYNALRQANWLFDFPGRRWTISRMLGI